MFRKEADFEAFERVMVLAHERQPIRILSYCVLSNHWHFVAWPEQGGQLTDFFRRLAHTHAMRWRVSHRTVVQGGETAKRWHSQISTLYRRLKRVPIAINQEDASRRRCVTLSNGNPAARKRTKSAK